MKINTFRGDLTDILAQNEALVFSLRDIVGLWQMAQEASDATMATQHFIINAWVL